MFNHHEAGCDNRAGRFPRILLKIIAGFGFAVLFALVFGWLVQHLWNWLMPMLFSLKTITFWQAFGLVLLSKILFGGFGHAHQAPHMHGMHHRANWMGSEWKPGGNYRNWNHYHRYWKEAGRQHFEEYLDKNGLAEKEEA